MMKALDCIGKIMPAACFLLTIGALALCSAGAGASDRFTDNGDGSLTDAQTGLKWTATDQGQDMDWIMADFLCSQLGMRKPTMDELAGLYNAEASNPTEPSEGCQGGYHIDDAFSITCAHFWASETDGLMAGQFSFADGAKSYERYEMFYGKRVLCVSQ